MYKVTMYNSYSAYSMNPISALSGYSSLLSGNGIQPYEEINQSVKNPLTSNIKSSDSKTSPAECETCNSRKYQDASDENVSFKSAQHLSPESSGSMIRAHEQEHVNNAYTKANQNNGRVLSANVAIHTSICPECGRSYISGGTTTTQIKYYNEENPYQKQLIQTDAAKYKGRIIDIAC